MYSADNLKKNSVLVCGAYGLGNSGDEAILEAILRRLRSLDPDIEVTVITRTPNETSKRNKVRTVNFFDYFGIRKVMKGTRLFISGGGSLVQDVTSTRSLLYYLWTIFTAKKLGCRVLMYACGIGPVNRKYNQKIAADCINACVDEITVRDEDSLRKLKELGINKPSIQLSADIALSLSPASEESIDACLSACDIYPRGRYICFSLRPWNGFEEKAKIIRQTAIYCYKVLGLTPVFLLLNVKQDSEATDMVTEGLSVPYRVIDKELPTDLLIGVISRMSVLVSIRLHAIVFAASVEVPFVALSYDPKVDSFTRYLGNNKTCNLCDVTAESLVSLIRSSTTYENRKNIRDGMYLLRENEKKNVSVVAKYLGKREIMPSKTMTRVAFFETDFKVGGIQKSLITILGKIDYTRCVVDVYYYDDDFFFEKPQNRNLRYIKLKEEPLSRFIPFRIYKALKAFDLSARSYDVAIDFNSYQNECALACILTPAKKHVMWIHNDMEIKRRNEWKYRVLWAFFKGKFKYYDEFVAVSPRIIDGFKRAARLPNAKVVTIQNYVDGNEIIQKSKERCDIAVDPEMYNICSVGRLCHQKGFDILLSEFAKAYQRNQSLRLYIIGDGPDKESLLSLCDELMLSDKVYFTGNLSNPFSLEAKMDGFALCSRYEGQGMVVREAQALGLDIFLSKNLEGYNPGIDVCDDIVSAMANAEKKLKSTDNLNGYNQEIKRQLEHLIFD